MNFSCVDDCNNGVSIVGSLQIVDTAPPRVVQHAVDRTAECDGTNNPPALQHWLQNYGGFRAHDVYGNFDTILDHFPRGSQLCITEHARAM